MIPKLKSYNIDTNLLLFALPKKIPALILLPDYVICTKRFFWLIVADTVVGIQCLILVMKPYVKHVWSCMLGRFASIPCWAPRLRRHVCIMKLPDVIEVVIFTIKTIPSMVQILH